MTKSDKISENIGSMKVLIELMKALEPHWSTQDLIDWIELTLGNLLAVDPLDEYLSHELPECDHLETWTVGPQLICKKCHDTLVNLDAERSYRG